MNPIQFPELSLVVLIGTSGAGKSTFARQHFLPTEVISSDYCRGIVSDDENSLEATNDAFELVHYIIGKRLKRGNLTVVDATNVQQSARQTLVSLAKRYHAFPVAIVLNTPPKISQERNRNRPDRNFGEHVIRHQHRDLQRSIRRLKKEGFKFVYVLDDVEAINQVQIERTRIWTRQPELKGPFDLIGDVHGCFVELRELLEKLGYKITKHRDRTRNYGYTVKAPVGRTAVFVGDLTDRGPASNEVLRLVMSMVKTGVALCVRGNHDDKLERKLNGRNVKVQHGLGETLEQLATEPEAFIKEVKTFLRGLLSHYVLDDGQLVVAHAGLKESMQGRGSAAIRSFAMYGETTGEIDEFGLPVRYQWAQDYRGKATVVYGHTPVPYTEFLNNTVDIDTGCVFGGSLTAMRYPERAFVRVNAKETYCEPSRPFLNTDENAATEYDDLLYLEDVYGKRILHTALRPNITIREQHATAALETMSRFAIDPKWLIYLPPTMSPCATSALPDYLEHPIEALEYYKKSGVQKVVCEAKHMGSRAVVIIGKDQAAIAKRFKIVNGGIGCVYTRTGRAFFNEDQALEQAFLARFQKSLNTADFWNKMDTDWAIFDCELMPWSAKAQSLLQSQYAAVGAAANAALPAAVATLEQFAQRNIDTADLAERIAYQQTSATKFRTAYRQYCWSVESLDDYTLAPFHLLATEGKTYTQKSHIWHMETIHAICQHDPQFLLATAYQVVDVQDKNAVQQAINWWLELTKNGGEGMVVKPLHFIEKGAEGRILQPAVKCRGQEYLRIIYGADYTYPSQLQKLKKRGLSHKRSMAAREFALGIESLERFVKKEPLRRVHECVFGILAMESEPVDPRL